MSERLGSSAVAVFGITGVVIVLVGVLSIAEGFRSAMRSTGDEDTVMVMRTGADSEMTSGMSGEHARIIADKPGIMRDSSGTLTSPELLVIVNHPLRRSGTDANVPLRGIEPGAFRVHTNVHIIEGRTFQTGRNEIIAGGRDEAVRRPRRRLDGEVGGEQLAGGRRVRGRRVGGGV